MDNEFDDKVMIENALEELQKDYIKFEKKVLNKVWAKGKVNFSLEYHLNRMIKEELLDIGRTLEIAGLSSLKKADLIEKLIDNMESKINQLLNKMDMERYKNLLNIVNKGGVLEGAEPLPLELACYYRECGIAFSLVDGDKYVIVIPKEFQGLIKSKDNLDFYSKLKKNEELIRLAWGMSYYYGVLTNEDMKSMIRKMVDYQVLEEELDSILYEGSRYYGEYQYFDDVIAHEAVLEPIIILEEHDKHKNLDYYSFSKKDFLDAAKVQYIDKNKAYKRFYNFLVSNFTIDSEEVEEIIEDLWSQLQNYGPTSDIFEEFLSQFILESKDEISSMMDEIIRYSNETRQWALKGFSSVEVRRKEEITEEKTVGRNDPCPCGSGKKYKRCCASKVISIKGD